MSLEPWPSDCGLAGGLMFRSSFRRPPGTPAQTDSGLGPLRIVPVTTLRGQETWPAFSPDASQIAFSWEGENRDNFDIYVKIIGAGEPIRLTRHPALDACPDWSPDGQSIAFVRADRGQMTLLSAPALGGAERVLVPLNLRNDFYGQYPTVSWSPDGNTSAFPTGNRKT